MKNLLSCLVAGLTIIACGCENDASNGELAGTAWRLAAWSEGSPDPWQFMITATFDETTISGTAAVNSYSGACLAAQDGSFSVGELQITLMAGSEEEMRAEEIYLELLQQARKYRVDAAALTLLDERDNETLRFNGG